MTKEEVRVCALEDELKEAKKEWDEAVSEIIAGKGIGVYDSPYHKRELEARRNVERLERDLERAKGLSEAITDEEVEALADTFAKGGKTNDDFSDEEKAFLEAVAGL